MVDRELSTGTNCWTVCLQHCRSACASQHDSVTPALHATARVSTEEKKSAMQARHPLKEEEHKKKEGGGGGEEEMKKTKKKSTTFGFTSHTPTHQPQARNKHKKRQRRRRPKHKTTRRRSREGPEQLSPRSLHNSMYSRVEATE